MSFPAHPDRPSALHTSHRYIRPGVRGLTFFCLPGEIRNKIYEILRFSHMTPVEDVTLPYRPATVPVTFAQTAWVLPPSSNPEQLADHQARLDQGFQIVRWDYSMVNFHLWYRRPFPAGQPPSESFLHELLVADLTSQGSQELMTAASAMEFRRKNKVVAADFDGTAHWEAQMNLHLYSDTNFDALFTNPREYFIDMTMAFTKIPKTFILKPGVLRLNFDFKMDIPYRGRHEIARRLALPLAQRAINMGSRVRVTTGPQLPDEEVDRVSTQFVYYGPPSAQPQLATMMTLGHGMFQAVVEQVCAHLDLFSTSPPLFFVDGVQIPLMVNQTLPPGAIPNGHENYYLAIDLDLRDTFNSFFWEWSGALYRMEGWERWGVDEKPLKRARTQSPEGQEPSEFERAVSV